MNTTTMTDELGVVHLTEYITHTVHIFEGAWMVVGNGLITVTLLCHKTIRKNRMATMTVLAIPDGLYGVGTLSGGIRRLHLVITGRARLPISAWECMQEFPTIFYIAGTQMTVLAMVLISVDRYISAAQPAYYLDIDENRYVARLILVVVAFGVATGALAVASSYWGWGDATTHEQLKSAVCLSTWSVPRWCATGLIAMTCFGGYTSIAIYGLVLRAYRKYMQKSTADAWSNIDQIKMERQRRLTVTMAFVTLMTLLFHSFPYTIILATTVFKMDLGFVGALNPLLWSIVCFNSVVNIFVYVKRHSDIRAAMYDVVRGRFKPIAVHPAPHRG